MPSTSQHQRALQAPAQQPTLCASSWPQGEPVWAWPSDPLTPRPAGGYAVGSMTLLYVTPSKRRFDLAWITGNHNGCSSQETCALISVQSWLCAPPPAGASSGTWVSASWPVKCGRLKSRASEVLSDSVAVVFPHLMYPVGIRAAAFGWEGSGEGSWANLMIPNSSHWGCSPGVRYGAKCLLWVISFPLADGKTEAKELIYSGSQVKATSGVPLLGLFLLDIFVYEQEPVLWKRTIDKHLIAIVILKL